MTDDKKKQDQKQPEAEELRYEHPEIVDHGSLQELTLSGSGFGADSLGSAGS